ncbi:hypothetical protein ACSV5M_16820 [Cellvibrio sp. ARAG 10.3]|uniref:hypothetical protein n=1 Tax=Cellvibrio sp. ARAG 10.3 TaxID=3451358 RepID=UPI003F456AD1
MIKQISLTLLIAALLTGCGGSDNDSDSNSSSSTPSSSSVASSSEAPSSAPASSEASSSESSAASSTPSADLSFGFEAGIDGWFVNGSENLIVTTELELSHDQINSALSIKPLTWVGDDYRRQARIALPGNPTLDNADIEVVINIPESYITDNTLTLQIIVDGPTADYGTYITMAELEAGDNTITVQRTVADATFLGIQLTTPPTTESILDAVLVKSVLIDLPEEGSSSSSSSSTGSGLLVDFEEDTAGTVYSGTGWVIPDELDASVVTIASITAGDGLPANGDSLNVLRVKPSNYNTIPLVEVTIPEGKTLADYSVTVDAYLPHSSLGLTEDGDNFYKDFFLLAGTSITSGANVENVAYHSHIPTEGNVDQWVTFTLTVDPVKGAALTGAIEVALGISRNADNTNDDAYYLDNIQLVELE